MWWGLLYVSYSKEMSSLRESLYNGRCQKQILQFPLRWKSQEKIEASRARSTYQVWECLAWRSKRFITICDTVLDKQAGEERWVVVYHQETFPSCMNYCSTSTMHLSSSFKIQTLGETKRSRRRDTCLLHARGRIIICLNDALVFGCWLLFTESFKDKRRDCTEDISIHPGFKSHPAHHHPASFSYSEVYVHLEMRELLLSSFFMPTLL